MIVGQKKRLEWINKMGNDIPHFVVIVGPRGSGKRTLAKYISKVIGCVYSECDSKVDTVREVIESAYKSNTRVLYTFANADTMRAEAKNAMLKITEEPPKNAWFCMTVTDSSYLLDTIKSRATVIDIEPYTTSELYQYAINKSYSDEDARDYAEIASTPYQLDELMKYGQEFIDFVYLVMDNISEVESANAFKSGQKLALKNEDDKYDLELFFKMFMTLCVYRIQQNPVKYAYGIEVTSKSLERINSLGVNKTYIYDMWVLNIREAWYDFD